MPGAEPRYHVEHLRPAPGTVATSTLQSVFGAPWREVSLVAIEAGERFGGRPLLDSEALVFVTQGHGTAHLLHAPVSLRPGISLTLFMGEQLDLRADAGEPLELFFAEIGAAPRGDLTTTHPDEREPR